MVMDSMVMWYYEIRIRGNMHPLRRVMEPRNEKNWSAHMTPPHHLPYSQTLPLASIIRRVPSIGALHVFITARAAASPCRAVPIGLVRREPRKAKLAEPGQPVK